MHSEDYYKSQIQKLTRERKIAALAMEICITQIPFKNNRAESKVRDRVDELGRVETSKLASTRKKLIGELGNIKYDGYILTSAVERALEEKQKRYGLELDYMDIHRIATTISNNPVIALKDFSYQYTDIQRRIESTKQLSEEEKKQEEERKKQEDQEKIEAARKRIAERQQTEQNIDHNHGPYRTGYEKPERPIKPYQAPTEEESKAKIRAQIDQQIADKYGSLGFTYDEKKRIKELYPELARYHDYYTVETLEKGMQIANIANKDSLNADDIMEIGINTFDVVTKELLFKTSSDQRCELFDKLQMSRNLEKYKEAYNKFMSYYKSLPSDKKAMIDSSIVKNKRYNNLFGEKIAAPSELTRKINLHVTKYIEENHNTFYSLDHNDFYLKTIHATKYMTIEEIVALYKGLVYQENKYGIYVENDEQRKSAVERRQKYLEILQREFARVVLSKMEEYNKQVDTNSMSEAELNQYYDNKNKKIAAICSELFHEKPLAKDLREIADRMDTEKTGKTLVQTYEAKKSAQSRIYGLSKAKQAIAKITGKWSRYMMLMEKEELTEKEQEEITTMFR